MRDPFEEQLSRVPLRNVPEHWKGRILAEAAQASQRLEPNRALWRTWLDYFWNPRPSSWAAAAAVWAIALTIHFVGRAGTDSSRLAAVEKAPAVDLFAEGRRQLASILRDSPSEPAKAVAKPPRRIKPGDQSLAPSFTYA